MDTQSNEALDDPAINGLTLPGPDRLGSGYKPLVFTPGKAQHRLEAPKGLNVPTQSGQSSAMLSQPYQGI